MKCKKETDHRRSNPELVYELKKVAIKLRKKNKSVKEISEITGLSDQTVRNLFKKYDEGGIAAIKPKKRGRKTGEKRHLSPTQEQELLGLLVDHDPEQFKIKGCLWTRDSVRELIKQKYGIEMPIRTVGEYLRRWRLTVQRPANTNSYSKHLTIQSLAVILEMTWTDREQLVSHKRSTTCSRVANISLRKPSLRISFQICSMGFISGVYGGI